MHRERERRWGEERLVRHCIQRQGEIGIGIGFKGGCDKATQSVRLRDTAGRSVKDVKLDGALRRKKSSERREDMKGYRDCDQ